MICSRTDFYEKIARESYVCNRITLYCLHVDMDKENQDVVQEDEGPAQKRRRILVLDSEDSEDEYKPSK